MSGKFTLCSITGCNKRKKRGEGGKYVDGVGWCCGKHKKRLWEGAQAPVDLEAPPVVTDIVLVPDILRKARVLEREVKVLKAEEALRIEKEEICKKERRIEDVTNKLVMQRDAARKERDGLVRHFINKLDGNVGSVCFTFYDKDGGGGRIVRQDTMHREMKAREENCAALIQSLKAKEADIEILMSKMNAHVTCIAELKDERTELKRDIATLSTECEALYRIVKVGAITSKTKDQEASMVHIKDKLELDKARRAEGLAKKNLGRYKDRVEKLRHCVDKMKARHEEHLKVWSR